MVRFVKADELMKLGESVSASGKVNAETDGRLTELLKKNDTTEEMRSSAIDYALSNRSALVGLSSSFLSAVLRKYLPSRNTVSRYSRQSSLYLYFSAVIAISCAFSFFASVLTGGEKRGTL